MNFTIVDTVHVREDVLSFSRKVKVHGNAAGGFLTSVELKTDEKFSRGNVNVFAPGMIYGSTEHLTDSAIGGKDLYSKGMGTMWIREDRLPAPLLGFQNRARASLAVFNSIPNGHTTTLDGHDLQAKTLIHEKIQLGSVGLISRDNLFTIGYQFPCTEGEYTYRGNTYPGGQLHTWRRRYHPIQDGFEQTYHVDFRFSREENFQAFYANAWRWAWNIINPKVYRQNIELEKRVMLDMLGKEIITTHGITGIPNWINANKNEASNPDMKTVMGFTGKTLEVANYLLYDAHANESATAKQHGELAYKIFDTFLKLPVNPPAGEGFKFSTGEVTNSLQGEDVIYLRSFGDDMKAMLKAVLREDADSYHYKEYIAWTQGFADWLLPQQSPEGGFPRSWKFGNPEVRDTSTVSSYTVIPYLILLSKATHESKYFDAAVKAAEHCWSLQKQGVFSGGTIDNPDVIDKEAGTLSLEAYLMLFEETRDEKWLARAKAAASFSETWIYAWNVPMPEDDVDSLLDLKKDISTVGMQLISTGHSLTDCYMAFDVDEFAKLYKYTNDQHYYDVANVLLHNTKVMLAIPGRLYDLRGPGFIQEHWSLAPLRGKGLHRGWLPWVSTSNLNGIIELKEFDQQLYKKMTSNK